MKKNKILPSWASIPEPKPKKGELPVTASFVKWLESKWSSPAINLIISLLNERKLFGIEKYGTELHTFNGRNAAEDIRQELGDLIIYFAQLVMENKTEEAEKLLNLIKESVLVLEIFLKEKQDNNYDHR
jgi:hypothetical protein